MRAFNRPKKPKHEIKAAYKISIWRDLRKTKEEKNLKHPASYPVSLCEKLIRTFSKDRNGTGYNRSRREY